MAFDLPYLFAFGGASVGSTLYLSSRWIDRATVTASSQQGLLTANHVQTYRPDQVWRGSAGASEWLAWDMGLAVPVEAVVILAHNLSTAAVLRYRLAASPAAVLASPAIDTGYVSAYPPSGKPTDPDWPAYFSLVTKFNETGYRYGRLDITDPANTDGYIQIGRLYAGPAFVPRYSVDLTWSFGFASTGEVVVSSFGRAFMDDRGPASRIFQLPYSGMDRDELIVELSELERYCGIARDFAFCLEPTGDEHFHRFAMQARFETLQPGQAMAAYNSSGQQVWQKTLTLAEVL